MTSSTESQTLFEETEQTAELESMWWGSWNYQIMSFLLKKTMINVLKILMEKVGNIQEQMHKVGRGIEILVKNHQEMLEIKKLEKK